MLNIFFNYLKTNKALYISFFIFLIVCNVYQIINPFLAFDEIYVYSPIYNTFHQSNIYYRELYEHRIVYGIIQDILAYIKLTPSLLIIFGIIFRYILSILCLFYIQLKGIKLNLILKLSFLIAMNFIMLAFANNYPLMTIYFTIVSFAFFSWIIYENLHIKYYKNIAYIIFILLGFIGISFYSGNLYFFTYLLLISYLFKIYNINFKVKNYFYIAINYIIPIILWLSLLFIIHYLVKFYYNFPNVYNNRFIQINNHYLYIKNLIPLYLQTLYIISFILILYAFKNNFKNFIIIFFSLLIFLFIPMSSDIILHKGGTQLRLMYLHIYILCQIIWCVYLYKNFSYKWVYYILYCCLFYVIIYTFCIYFANAISVAKVSYREKLDIINIKNKYQELCSKKDCKVIVYNNLPWDYYDKYKFKYFKHYININNSFLVWKWWFKEDLSYYNINISDIFYSEDLNNNKELSEIINKKLENNIVYPDSNAIFEENYNNIKTIFIILSR